jgi:hypothetical protein
MIGKPAITDFSGWSDHTVCIQLSMCEGRHYSWQRLEAGGVLTADVGTQYAHSNLGNGARDPLPKRALKLIT